MNWFLKKYKNFEKNSIASQTGMASLNFDTSYIKIGKFFKKTRRKNFYISDQKVSLYYKKEGITIIYNTEFLIIHYTGFGLREC